MHEKSLNNQAYTNDRLFLIFATGPKQNLL